MLERMRGFSKSWWLKGLLALVALSFVISFASAPFQKRRKERILSAVKVNGNIVSRQEFFRLYRNMLADLEEKQGWPADEQQQKDMAEDSLDALVQQALQKQVAEQLGLIVTDEEVSSQVRQIWQQLSGGQQPLTARNYSRLLAYLDFRSADAFESALREQLKLSKLNTLLSQAAKVSEAELLREFRQPQRQVQVDLVAFKPEHYTGQIELNEADIQAYYDENKEQYREPERVRVDYLEIRPGALTDEVTVTDVGLEAFYQKNQQDYQTDPQISVDYVFFSPEGLKDDVAIGEQEIQEFFEQHSDWYEFGDRVKARYVAVPVSAGEGPNAPTDKEIENSYAENAEQYMQVDASQIVLEVPEGASEEEKQSVRDRLGSLREEILGGRDFAEVAREESDDPSADRGGSLGLIRRGQRSPALEEVIFSLEAGEVSEVVEGPAGFYLFKVNSVFQRPLEEVRDQVVRGYIRQELQNALKSLDEGEMIPAGQWQDYQVEETGFFERAQPINDTIGDDYFSFSNAAFRLNDGEVSGVVYGMNHLFVIGRLETKPSRPKTLDEAREEVMDDIRTAKGVELAKEKASQAHEVMTLESLSFEAMAERTGMEIQSTGFFGPNNPPASLGPQPYMFMMSAFSLQPDQVSDVVETERGAYIIRGDEQKPAEIPPLEDVRPQVEADFKISRAVDEARNQAWDKFLNPAMDNKQDLRDLPDLGPFQVRDSGLFGMNEPIPGLNDPNDVFHRAAFSLEEEGEVLNDVIEIRRPGSEDIQGFYLLQLKERVDSYVPWLGEIRDKVAADLKRKKALEIAKAEAEEFAGALRQAVQEGTVEDLESFAQAREQEVTRPPYFGEMGFVEGAPGAENTPAFSKTALALDPGEYSGLIALEESLGEPGEEEKDKNGKTRLTGYYLFQVVDKKQPDEADFQDRRAGLKEQLLYSARRTLYQSWLNELQELADVQPNQGLLADYGLAEAAEEVADATGEN